MTKLDTEYNPSFVGWIRNGKPIKGKIFHSVVWIFVHALLFAFLLEYLKARYDVVAFIIFVILPQIGLYLLLSLVKPSKESSISKLFTDKILFWVIYTSIIIYILTYLALAVDIIQTRWGFLDYYFHYLFFEDFSIVLLFLYPFLMISQTLPHYERHLKTDAQLKYDISKQTKKINSLNRENKKLESEINEADKKIQKISRPLLKIEERILELEKDISNERQLFAALKKKYPFLSSGEIIDNR